jgi:putative ABC transport system substrate-binding protein
MHRRQFIALLGVSWPAVAQAQRSKTFRVGILANEKWPPLDGLRDGFRSLGYVEGQSIELVNRYVEGETAKYPSFAAELVGLPVDVIVTWGTPASIAARDATTTIPIIMTSGDPVAVGLVPGLAQRQGNVTGFSTQAAELEGKRLELINELIPNVSRVVVLSNPSNPYCKVAVEQARRAAAVLQVKLDVVEIGHERELDNAFAGLVPIRPDAILVVADPFLASQQIRIAEFLVRAKIPSIYTYREQVTAVASFPTRPITTNCFGALHLWQTRFTKDQTQAISRSSNRPNLNWSSTSRRRMPSVSRFRRRCSHAPTR